MIKKMIGDFLMDNIGLYILLGLAVLLYVWYASIITKRNKAKEAFSGIDVQLKKRADLIPNVLTIAKKFMAHEKELLEEVTRLRTEVQKQQQDAHADEAAHIKERFMTEAQLQKSMGQLMIAVENYPELKSDTNMLEAQRAYQNVEENIAAARRFYNAAVNALHNAIQIFPGNVIAGLVGVTEMPFYEAEEADRKAVNAADVL